ncbi:MAG: threonine/serine dehydratase [Pseudomonadales bacterium]|jgi:threonine dehydratase|nr:threonine/serine dehydratase [Pseudomonadales bacterium]
MSDSRTPRQDSATLPTRADVVATAQLLEGRVVRTPLLRAPCLDQRTGGRILLKLENLQHTNSFKFRGAMSRMLRLDADERARGVLAWSSGNHAQAVAAAAEAMGLRATIVMPADAPAVKRRRTERSGARILTYDRRTEDREAIGRALAAEEGQVIIPPYEDRWVMAGQGTAGLEILAQSAEQDLHPEALLVCTGGGGLTAGCALALEGTGAAVHTVEPEGYDDHARSLASGIRLAADLSRASICDALLAPMPGEMTFAVNRDRVRSGLVVSEDEVRAAVAYAFEELRLVVEPGGAVALAAILAGRIPTKGRTLAVMVSGGNIDPVLLQEILAARGP